MKLSASLLLGLGAFPASLGLSPPLQQQQEQLPLHPTLSPELLSTANSTAHLLSLHKHLIEIESISGHEGPVADWLTTYLRHHGYTVEQQPVAPLKTNPHKNRYNIYAYPSSHPPTPEKDRRTRILFTSHIDTVPPFVPYRTTASPPTVWGRASADAKGSVAAQITALNEMLATGAAAPGDAGLLFVVGEEIGGDGMRAANALSLAWEAVVFGEPTEGKLALGHKGIALAEIRARGKAAHSGYPWMGESAVEMLVPALAAVVRLELPRSERFGNSTLNLGLLRGGVAPNVVAKEAYAQAQIRLGGGEPEEAMELIREAVHAVDERLEVTWTIGYGPIHCDTDAEGFETAVMNYGTDVPHLKGDHKRYLYGPGSILVAHADDERVEVKDLLEAVQGYKRLALQALMKGK